MNSSLNDSVKPVIQLNQLLFSWQQGNPVLDIPDLSIMPGEKIFIRGPSGSGKTTLLGLLGGVLTPDQGQVNVLGQNIGQLSATRRDRFRAHHIGFIFQMFNLIPYLSLIENITLPLSFSDKRQLNVQQKGFTQEEEARRLLSSLNLSGEDTVKRSVTELSIGQQQRVAVARALIGHPELVIADEPTSALDTDTREAFIKLLFNECEAAGNTLIFVSHDPTLESLFDRSISLNDINRAAQNTVKSQEP